MVKKEGSSFQRACRVALPSWAGQMACKASSYKRFPTPVAKQFPVFVIGLNL